MTCTDVNSLTLTLDRVIGPTAYISLSLIDLYLYQISLKSETLFEDGPIRTYICTYVYVYVYVRTVRSGHLDQLY